MPLPSKWLIRADQPFKGFAQSWLTEAGTVAYTEGLTPEQYAAERGFPVRVIDDEELTRLSAAYEDSLITDPVEETEEQFWYALEVLPPCRWRTVRGVELFHISERLTGDLVSWHACIKFDAGDFRRNTYWSFTDRASRNMDELAEKVATAAREARKAEKESS